MPGPILSTKLPMDNFKYWPSQTNNFQSCSCHHITLRLAVHGYGREGFAQYQNNMADPGIMS